MLTGYHSQHRQSNWQSFKQWAYAKPTAAEMVLGYTSIIFGAFIGLQLAIVSILDLIYWGL